MFIYNILDYFPTYKNIDCIEFFIIYFLSYLLFLKTDL